MTTAAHLPSAEYFFVEFIRASPFHNPPHSHFISQLKDLRQPPPISVSTLSKQSTSDLTRCCLKMDSIDAVMNTTEWRDASAATISRRANNHGEPLRICRRKVIARHMKLAAYLGALGEENAAQDSQAMSAVNGCCGQPRKTAPFHPLHCAASQGMLDEGVILWEEAANQVIFLLFESRRKHLVLLSIEIRSVS